MRNLEQQFRALRHRSPAPAFKSRLRRFHRRRNVLGSSLLKDAHHLLRMRRVDGLQLRFGPYPVSADHVSILAPKLLANHVQRLAHRAHVLHP